MNTPHSTCRRRGSNGKVTCGALSNRRHEHVDVPGSVCPEALREVYGTGIGIGKTRAVSKGLGGQHTTMQFSRRYNSEHAACTGYSITGNFLRTDNVMVKNGCCWFSAAWCVKPCYLDWRSCKAARATNHAMDARGKPVAKFQAPPNFAVWTFLQMEPAQVEVRVRRLRFWQKGGDAAAAAAAAAACRTVGSSSLPMSI